MQFFSASIEMGMFDTGNMTQWLRALTALAEDLGLIPSPYMMTLNHGQQAYKWYTDVHSGKTHAHKIILKGFKDTDICFSLLLFLLN